MSQSEYIDFQYHWHFQQILEMFFGSNMSIPEIAQYLGDSVQYVTYVIANG